ADAAVGTSGSRAGPGGLLPGAVVLAGLLAGEAARAGRRHSARAPIRRRPPRAAGPGRDPAGAGRGGLRRPLDRLAREPGRGRAPDPRIPLGRPLREGGEPERELPDRDDGIRRGGARAWTGALPDRRG